MDNLFNSKKLYSAGYAERTLMVGVCRINHRGLCPSIIQKEEKNPARAEKLRGTTNVALLKDDPSCPDLSSISTYYTKPVLMLPTIAEKIGWIAKGRKVWSKEKNEYANVSFLRLNMINDYNYQIGDVDIADQLHGSYRPDHWLQNNKWW